MSEDTKWICPICQSTEYKEIKDNVYTANATNNILLHYECSGCSIHFGDIKKFNAIEIIGDVADELINEYLQTGGVNEGN